MVMCNTKIDGCDEWRGPTTVTGVVPEAGGFVYEVVDAVQWLAQKMRAEGFETSADALRALFPGVGDLAFAEERVRPYDPPSSQSFTELMDKAKHGELEAA
jgi:hypothetical protein